MNKNDIVEYYFNQIYQTAGFKNQVKLIDEIFGDTKIIKPLFLHVIENFSQIEIDRRDKFYYLIDKALEKVKIDLDFIENTGNLTLMQHLIENCNLKITKGKLRDFLKNCHPTLLASINFRRKIGEKLDKKEILKMIENENLSNEKIKQFYKIINNE
ncbi:hypothetical protein NUSPORA_02076 [Nucleospora cyclopteri]